MPEQQAWSAVSVCSPHPSPSPASFLFFTLLHLFLFPSPTAAYLSHTLSPPPCSHSTSPWQICSFPLTLFFGLHHPSPVLPSYLFISILCSFHPETHPPPHTAPFARTGARWCHHFYFLPPCSSSSPQLSILFPIVFKESVKRQKKCVQKGGGGKKRSEEGEMKIEGLKREVGARIRERRGRRVTEERLKAHYFPLWWEKMSEGAIIKLEFFNTVKNGALTAKRQCAGRAPTTHGEPPN